MSRIRVCFFIVSFVLFIVASALHLNGEMESASILKTVVLIAFFVKEGLTL